MPSSARARHVTHQTLSVNGQLLFVVGVPIPAVETQVFEVFQLDQPRAHAAGTLLLVLGVGALATSLIGMGGGLWVSRRAVRPLERGLGRRRADRRGRARPRASSSSQADREVQQLTESFNAMV